MTFYNAIILDKKKRIVGRTHITNLSRFSTPSSKWIAYHEGERLTDVELPPKLIGPHNPITIMQPYRSGRQFRVEVKYFDAEPFPFQVTTETTVGTLKAMIERNVGIPQCEQRLSFRGRHLEDDKRLVDCNVKDGATISLVTRITGGAGLHMLDLEGETVTGSGEMMDPHDEDIWKGYSYGLNIIGRCENRKCKSRQSGNVPIVNRRLSHFRLTGDPLECPACERKTFKPANFLAAGVRSAIKFRKSGEIQVKSTLLESSGPYPEYAKFAESNDTVEYDEIEVKTTDLYRSPFFCNLCDNFIVSKDREAGQPCGHYFHGRCANKFNNCPICSAKLLVGKAVEELFEL